MREIKSAENVELALIKAAAYELKKPLAHIYGLSCQLDEGVFSSQEEISQQYKYLKNSSKRLQVVIDSLIFLGQIEANQLALDLDTLNPASVVNAVAYDLKATANHYHKVIDMSFSNSLSPVNANYEAMNYALFNLVDTTIRTSKSEVIELKVKRDTSNCLITIKDVGEDLNQTQFNKIDGSILKNLQALTSYGASSGLGIYIAKNLGKTFNGNITFSNSRGRRIINLRVPNSRQLQLV